VIVDLAVLVVYVNKGNKYIFGRLLCRVSCHKRVGFFFFCFFMV
jgi:hypothetical protein